MKQIVYLPSNRSPKPREQRFRILQPVATNYGWVSCKDYECEQFQAGFKLILPIGGEDELWVRRLKDKRVQVALDQTGKPLMHRYWFTETVQPDGLVEFVFPPGQPCFQASRHRWHIRPPFFAHERNETRRNLRFGDFTDLMNNESYKIAHEREKG